MREFEYGVDYAAYNLDFIENLYNIRVCGVPLSFYLLDLRKTDTHCHLTSDILAHFIEGAFRVEGEISTIPGDDKGHSWVEVDDIVYETTKGAMWKKSSFYQRYNPANCKVYTSEETFESIKQYLKYNENMNELYVAWIQDMEENISGMVYGKILQRHIERFREEKDLDNKDLDQDLVEKFLNDLRKAYQATIEFKKSGGTKKN